MLVERWYKVIIVVTCGDNFNHGFKTLVISEPSWTLLNPPEPSYLVWLLGCQTANRLLDCVHCVGVTRNDILPTGPTEMNRIKWYPAVICCLYKSKCSENLWAADGLLRSHALPVPPVIRNPQRSEVTNWRSDAQHKLLSFLFLSFSILYIMVNYLFYSL